MESNRPRTTQRRSYRLRNPERATQTVIVPKPPSEKLDSSIQFRDRNLSAVGKNDAIYSLQVWVVTEEPKAKMTRIELVSRHVQCIVPSLPGRLIILLAVLATLCGMASYMTKGDIYNNTVQSTPGHVKNLRDTFVEVMWAMVNPIISYMQTKS